MLKALGAAWLVSSLKAKMNAAHASDVKTKILIAAVALAVVGGQVVTFIGSGWSNTTGWDVVKLPCEFAWTVLAFPLGWLGLIAAAFARFRWSLPNPDLLLWTGVALNGALWSWIVYRIAMALGGQGTNHGFDASAFSVRLREVRQSHVAAAHARSRSVYARKGLVAIASRAVRRSGYFFDRKRERPTLADAEKHKYDP
jgi:hypothetical protein